MTVRVLGNDGAKILIVTVDRNSGTTVRREGSDEVRKCTNEVVNSLRVTEGKHTGIRSQEEVQVMEEETHYRSK